MEESLYNSEKVMVAEISTLKASLEEVEKQKSKEVEVIPTSDKSIEEELSPKKEE